MTRTQRDGRTQPGRAFQRVVVGAALIVAQVVMLPLAGGSPVQAAASLSVQKTSSANGSDVYPGDTLTYTIVVTNDSTTDTATDLVLDDALPAGVSYVPGSTTRTYNIDGLIPGTYTSPNQPVEVDPTATGAPGAVVTSFDTTGLVPAGATLTSYSLSVAGEANAPSWLSEIGLVATYPAGTAYDLVGGTFGGDGSGTYAETRGPTPVTGSAEGVYEFRWTESFLDDGVDNSVNTATFTIGYEYPGRVSTNDNLGTPPNLVTAAEGIDLLPGETMTVTFDVLVNNPLALGTTELTNTATASSDAGTVGPSVGSVTDTVALSDLELTKVVLDGTSAWNGGSLTYRLSLTNNGPDPATEVVVTDVLPPSDLSYDSSSGGGSYDSATGEWSIASLANGSTVTIDIVATVDAAEGATVTNAAEVTSVRGHDTDSTPGNGIVGEDDDDSVDFTVLARPPADLSLTKTVDATAAYESGSVTYTLELTNDGPGDTGAVVVDEALPAGLTFQSAIGPGTYDSAAGEWSLVNVASGQTVSLDIVATVTATEGTSVTNGAEVASQWATDPDSTPGNGSTDEDDDDSVAFTVLETPTVDLSVTKSVDVTNAGPGDLVTFTIEVTNGGPDALGAGGAQITDALPASLGFLTFSTVPVASGTYDPGTGVWDFGSLAVGETKQLTINAEVLDLGFPSLPSTVTNTATATVNVPVVEDNPGDETDSASFGIPGADLSVDKLIDGQKSIVADILTSHTFTVSVTNAGPDTATDVVIDDVLPSGFILQASSVTLGNYDQGLWTIPSLPVGTETLTIDVVIGLGGPLNNTAEVVSVAGNDPDSTPGNGDLAEDDMDRVYVTATTNGVVTPGLPGAVCYAVADSTDTLVRIIRDTGAQEAIGSGIGVPNAESLALNPFTGRLYTVNGVDGQFGEIDLDTGVFAPIGSGTGSGSGYADNGTTYETGTSFSDIDGMHFDPTTGALYASVRRGDGTAPGDLLIQIDPATGAHVNNAFDRDGNPSTDEDYVTIERVDSGGIRQDIDGLAVDLDGTLYGVANTGGGGNQVLVRINKITGAATVVGVFYLDETPEGPNDPSDDTLMSDLEGISIDLQGQMYVVTGSSGVTANGFHDVNKTPEGGRVIAFTDNNLTLGSDYESLTCVMPPTDIAVDKVVDDSAPDMGGQVTYTIVVTNNGPAVAGGIVIDDVLPAGVSYDSNTVTQGVYDAVTGEWALGGLLVLGQATMTITVDVTAAAGTTIVNTATVDRLDQPDTDPTNDSDSATLVVGANPADIRGAVYDDVDENGFIAAGDAPLEGVVIELFEDADMNGVPDGPAIATTTTLADGTYLFEDIPDGTYLVVETDPAGYVSVTDIDGPNDNTISVTMPGGVDSNGNDFLDKVNTTDAQNDVNQTPIDTPVSGSVATNDTDTEGDGQTVTSALVDTDGDGMIDEPLMLGTRTAVFGTDNTESTVPAGFLTLNADGSYTYEPASGFTGTVPAEYTVTDDDLVLPATDSATLTIEVFGDVPLTNDPPVANDDTNTTEIGVPVSANVITPNDSDPDGDSLEVTELLYDTDGDGLVDDPVTVGVPTPVYGTDIFGNVVPAGTLVINDDGTYTFTPNNTFVGDVPAEYTIEDPDGLSDSATLTITIEPDDGNSTSANDDANAGPQDVNQLGNILDNDVDLEGDTQSITLIDTNGDGTPDTAPVAGTALPIFQNSVQIGTLDIDPATGAYIWDPAPTYIGTAVVPYTVVDNGAGPATDDATLYLTTYPGIDYDDSPTSYADAAALLSPDLFLGSGVTQDMALPGEDADTDDGPDFDNARVTGSGYELDIAVTNTTGEAAEVCGWIDLDMDGVFEVTENVSGGVAGEQCVTVPNGATSVTLTWSGVGGLVGNSWTQFRIAPAGLADAASGPSGVGEVENYPINFASLPVTLAYFSSTSGGSVTWWTSSETNNAGFVVYGENADGERVALTDLILGSGDSLTPLEYSTTVSTTTDLLWLGDIDNDGVETLHGPFTVGETIGQVPDPISIDWGRAAPRTGFTEVVPGAKSVVRRAAGPPVGSAVEVNVTVAGLQRVSFEDLVSAGVDWTGVSTSSLAVVDADGRPVPVTSRFRVLRPGAYIEFHGDPVDTLYTDTNVYRLVVDSSLVVQMGIDRSRPPRGTSQEIIESGEHAALFEEQVVFSSSSPGDEPWFWKRAVSFFGGVGSASFTVDVDELVDGDASIAVEVWGASANADDRTVTLLLNGTQIDTAEFAGVETAVLSGAIPEGILLAGANAVQVNVQGPAGVLLDTVDIDSIEITHQRNLVAVDGAADVTGVVGRVEVDGFTARDITVLRVDPNGDVTLVRRAMTIPQGDGTFSVRFSSSSTDARFVVAQGSAAAVASVEDYDAPTGLLDGAADLLIISHSAFADHLGDLVAAREAQGLHVKVVEVGDVYSAYSGGVFDPAAISDYISDAADAFGDPAVLLVGADSNDYRNYTGAGSTAYIPTLYGSVGVGSVNWSPIDPKFVDLDDDDLPDLPLGRFPVRNLAELDAMIAKTLAYGNDGTAVFAAEAGFGGEAATIAGQLDEYSVTTAYLDDIDVGAAHDLIMSQINSGVGLTLYFGHSSPDQWANGGLLRTSDVVDMTNTTDPTLAIQFGCWNTYFSDPTQQSLGVAMATHTGGAAGVVGATTLTNSIHDAMFGTHLAEALNTETTIGDALSAAKASLAAVTSSPDIALGWTLLGDPTAAIAITP